MTQGDIVHGFRLMRKYPSGDFKGTLYAFEHEKSGAQVFWFSADAEEAVGVIGVRTPATDDTGVAHVLEHMLCYRSRKYSESDSWQMLTGDTKAALNAFTSHHSTSFHFKSRSQETLRTYLDFWLDHLYHPLALADPRLLATEGWRYALAPDGALSYNGIVYNEIRTLDDVYKQSPMARALTPGTPDSFFWGGRPDALTKLRPEDVVAFHKTYYHPANTSICLHGDIDIEDTLQFLDTAYFSSMERRAPAPFDEAYPPPLHTLRREETYEVGSRERDHRVCECCFLWLLEKDAWAPTPTEMDFLSWMLFRGKSPIRRILKRDSIQLKFSKHLERLGCQRALKLDIYDGSEEKILRALLALRGYHFQQKDIVRTLKAMERKQRAAAKKPTDAVDICQTILMDVSTGRDLAEDFHAQTDELLLRMHLSDGSLDRFVQQCLACQPPSLFLTLTSSYELRMQRLAEEKERLARKQAQLTEEERAAIRAQNEALVVPAAPVVMPAAPRMQDNPSEEACTPVLTEETIGGATLLYAGISDNKLAGKCYVDMRLDASHLPLYSFETLFFLKEALSHLPTIGTRGASFPHRFSSVVHGYTPERISFCTPPGAKDVHPVFPFHFTCAVEDVKKALNLIREMWTATSFADESAVNRFLVKASIEREEAREPKESEREFVLQHLLDAIRPHNAARRRILRAMRGCRPDTIPETMRQLFCREHATVFFAADKKDVPAIREELEKFLLQLPKARPSRRSFHVQMKPERDGFYTAQPLQFLAAGGRIPYHDNLGVLTSLLYSDYFYPRIRQLGGAYEVNMILGDTGEIGFYSGRDPHLAETLDTFAHAADFVRTLDVSKERLAAAIDGALPPLARHGSLEESVDALTNWNVGRTEADVFQDRQDIRKTTVERLRAYASDLERILQDGSLCVIGNEIALRESADHFQTLQPWNNEFHLRPTKRMKKKDATRNHPKGE